MAHATRHPEHPSKVIILSAAARLIVERMAHAFARLGGAKAYAAAMDFWQLASPANGARYAEWCLPQYFRRPQDPNHDRRSILSAALTDAYLAPDGPAHTCDFRKALGRVQCPTLVMGGEDDPVTTIEDMAEIAAPVPQHLVQFERIPNCGHGPFLDEPEHTARIMRAFILS